MSWGENSVNLNGLTWWEFSGAADALTLKIVLLFELLLLSDTSGM